VVVGQGFSFYKWRKKSSSVTAGRKSGGPYQATAKITREAELTSGVGVPNRDMRGA